MKTFGRKSALILSALLATASLGIVGCERDGPLENAGEEIDDAVDDVADEIEDGIDEATDESEAKEES